MIPIPLKPEDADASVPLQEVFYIVFQYARYDLSVKYHAPLTQEKLPSVQSPMDNA